MTKIYLNVPFSEKEKVKLLGGRWDPINKKWFVNEDNYIESKFSKWSLTTDINEIHYCNASSIGSVTFCPYSHELHLNNYPKSEKAEIRINLGNKYHHKVNSASVNKTPKSSCYIATHLYGRDHFITNQLRLYRDEVIINKFLGKSFIYIYYKTSPLLIKSLGKSKIFKKVMRMIIIKMVRKQT
jgi:hypothetical protein